MNKFASQLNSKLRRLKGCADVDTRHKKFELNSFTSMNSQSATDVPLCWPFMLKDYFDCIIKQIN